MRQQSSKSTTNKSEYVPVLPFRLLFHYKRTSHGREDPSASSNSWKFDFNELIRVYEQDVM